jgi:hypothetical protein
MNNLINKETISELVFPFNDVLEKKDDQQKRLEKLKTAMVLGNGFKHKVKIIFRDLHERRFVETTIWFVSDSHVTLKSGLIMPISCIEDVLLS